jgi:plasmid replication initiation protein
MNEIKMRKTAFQSNFLTETYLPFTKIESDIFSIILSILKRDTYEYKLNIKDLLRVLNMTENNYQSIISSIEGLSKKQIKFRYDTELNTRQRIVNVIDYIDFPLDIDRPGINDTLTITISRGIIPHLFNLKQNFTSYQISSFLVLRTTYSKKLYTLFSQYKHTGKLIKTKDEIQYLLGVNYSDFSVLMSKEIKPSIKEITDKTNINNIKISPIKKGKSVSGYIFHFDWTSPQLEIPILPPSMNSQEINVYDNLITNYQLTNYQSKKILDNVPYLDITKTLYQISIAKSKITTSIGSYTCGVFKKKFGLDL